MRNWAKHLLPSLLLLWRRQRKLRCLGRYSAEELLALF